MRWVAPTEKDAANDALEKRVWDAADALRNNMDAAEYKHVVLGLMFLTYRSDAVEHSHTQICGSIDA